MLYKDFLKLIGHPEKTKQYESVYSSMQKMLPTKIEIRWSTGGMTGGSCWGGTPHPYISSDQEPAFTELDNILEKVCPNISYLKYKKLTDGLFRHYDETVPDYYGNSTNYAVKSVVLKELYDKMVEMELLAT